MRRLTGGSDGSEPHRLSVEFGDPMRRGAAGDPRVEVQWWQPLDRRGFLTALAGVGVSAGMLSACGTQEGSAAGDDNARLDRLGVQLYTLRSLLADDVPGTLAALAEIGYQEVETAGTYGLTGAQFRAELDRVGLVSPAGHHSLGALRENRDEVFELARTLGQEWVIVPSLPGDVRGADGFRRVSEEMNRLAEAARAVDLRFGFHNHATEFTPLPEGGTGYDILLAETDPALVDMELDLFWAVRGGHDPVDLFQQHPGRFALCHVKDMADMGGASEMVDVGAGEIDFARIFRLAEVAGLQHYFVEHDDPDDALSSVRASYTYLRQLVI